MSYPAHSELSPLRLPSGEAMPVGWEAKRLKFLGEPIIGLTYSPDDVVDVQTGTLVLRANNIQSGKLVPDDAIFVSTHIPAKLRLKLGDILICSRNGSRHLIGKNGRVTSEFVGSTFGAFNTVFRSDVNAFLYHVFNSSLFEFQSGSYLTSTINQLTIGTLSSIVVPVPPPEEQNAITAFLDWKTGQIDALMARKQELLERLKEKRLAVITQAVTRGLNPAAPRRDSGIPWLGQVPQHWDVFKMSWVCASIRDGTHNPPDRASGIHRLLSVRNVQDGKFALLDDDRTMAPEDFAELQRSYTIEENDIVLAIVGATTGKSAIVGRLGNVTVQRSLAILRPDSSAIESSFLNYVVQSPVVQTEIALTVFKYSAQPGIYLDDVSRLPVVRPPLSEQATITAFLDAETEKLDALVRKVEAAIDRLTEYRAALIIAATTGKIDVRSVAIPQPAQP